MARSLGVIAILLLCGGHRLSTAGDWPRPEKSTVDPCLIACPAGDSNFRVIARSILDLACINSVIMVDLCECPDARFAPLLPSDRYQLVRECWTAAHTTTAGVADLSLRIGGTCSAPIPIYGDGVRLATRTAMASPDQNGDLVVDDRDLALMSAQVGTTSGTADFDCDSAVTEADVAIARAHLGHAAMIATPVHTSTWGQIKALYR